MLLSDNPEIPTRALNILKRKSILTSDDLARFVPRKYIDYRKVKNINDCADGDYAAIRGKVVNIEKKLLKGSSSREYIHIKLLQEDDTPISCMMFNNLYLYDQYLGLYSTVVVACGRISYSPVFGYTLQNPQSLTSADLFQPFIKRVYTKFSGMTENTLNDLIFKQGLAYTQEPLEKEVIARDKLPDYQESLYMMHKPKKEEDIVLGKKRLVYNDLLYFALSLQKDNVEIVHTNITFTKKELVNAFIKKLPFKLTKDQLNSIRTMVGNARDGIANNVLLQGDVGCGKTIVAACLMLCCAENGYQSVLMAPRTVLAKQHYEEISHYAEMMNLTCVFLHSGMKAKEKRDAYQLISSGKADFIVGTHSCFSNEVEYANLGLIVTDEEHLFGVNQKEAIKEKAQSGVHYVSMSATPIPRTLTDVIYGESAKTILSIKEKPAGRKEIITKIQPDRDKIFPFIEKEIKGNHRCYVVCPAIEDDDAGLLTSIETMEKEYKEYFEKRNIYIGIITGKMKVKDINETVNKFISGEYKILLSTTVVEVGVNVPDATVMVVEQAERFGLASLHQLRGRVGRSSLQSYCFLVSEDNINERLLTMERTNDGFEIAEADMMQRGGGDLIGTQQAGFNKYLSEVMKHPKMYQHIRETAKFCLENGYGQKLVELYQENLNAKALELEKQK